MHPFDRQTDRRTDRKATAIPRSNRVRGALKNKVQGRSRNSAPFGCSLINKLLTIFITEETGAVARVVSIDYMMCIMISNIS